ncbi:hypothetical protein IU459_32630 [Nocardia amamiensis]|uniref:Uncharacterized protein n=1 Tax=Nocardia amamiensis TaxID=404578 RepID=A0ABS0D087_9NOCA|nr:hypothetical protein [Nocardia amamiensis]MBF6302251.1 hypothetical protein [Nocardia amamiensis]
MTRSNHNRRKEVRAYMARHDGVTYTQALRALEDQAIPVPTDGPFMDVDPTYGSDVNPICGHRLSSRCGGCGVCRTCDGCYCDDLRQEADLEAYSALIAREHAEHVDEPDPTCPTCEYDRERSKDFTECPKCSQPLQGFWHFSEHTPPYCFKDKPHPPGLDWSHLIGKRITIDTHWCYQGKMAEFAASWTGTVTGRLRASNTGALTDHYDMRLDPAVPQPNNSTGTIQFDPREFTITEH